MTRVSDSSLCCKNISSSLLATSDQEPSRYRHRAVCRTLSSFFSRAKMPDLYCNNEHKPPSGESEPLFAPEVTLNAGQGKNNTSVEEVLPPNVLHHHNAPQEPLHPGRRRKARELALQVLYAMELSGQAAQVSIQRIEDCFRPPDNVWEYASHIIRGVEMHKDKIDEMIQRASEHWKLSRMATVDRNVLRMAVFELMFCIDVPKKVAINEAVELGKKFGTEDSGAFVNGVLDKVASFLEK